MASLFEEITSEENIKVAYLKSQEGKAKYRAPALSFYIDEEYNLSKLRESLLNKTYAFGEYHSFYVNEPKRRLIHAPRYHSKIVQLAVNEKLKEILYPTFIYDSYACMTGKGTHKAVDRVQDFMRRAKSNYGDDTYIINLDISKFFYTIDRSILKKLLRRTIKCKDTLWLLDLIIDSVDDISEIGLPLGNTLSQLSANVYLNKLDQYSKRFLGIKYYVRYMDDVVAFAPNKEVAREWIKAMDQFVKVHLNLDVNPKKTQIFPLAQGCNAYGFKIWPTHKLLRNDSKKNIKRKSKKMLHLLKSQQMTIQKAEQILNSWLGHARYGNSYNFIQSLIERNPYIYMNEKGILRVDESKLKIEEREYARWSYFQKKRTERFIGDYRSTSSIMRTELKKGVLTH